MSDSRAVEPWIRRSANPKLDRILVTPEGVPLHVTVASAGARAGALALDIVIIVGLIILATLFGALLLWAFGIAFEGALENASGPLQFLAVLWIIAVFLFRNAYFLYFELGDRAATWGKRAVGIRVAARDGGRLTAEAVIARNIVRDIELFLPLVFLTSGEASGSMTDLTAWTGFLWVLMFLLFPLFNRDRLRGGDVIAGTWVIRNVKKNLGGIVAPRHRRQGRTGPRRRHAISSPTPICRSMANMNCRPWKMFCAPDRKTRWKKWLCRSARKSAGNRAAGTSGPFWRLIIRPCARGWSAA